MLRLAFLVVCATKILLMINQNKNDNNDNNNTTNNNKNYQQSSSLEPVEFRTSSVSHVAQKSKSDGYRGPALGAHVLRVALGVSLRLVRRALGRVLKCFYSGLVVVILDLEGRTLFGVYAGKRWPIALDVE